ncbi:hypothetical protein KR222_007576, partial [Zaprionus bogoriensis]
FLADKTHDDISNILQQWKTNNQQQTQLLPQTLHYNHEQGTNRSYFRSLLQSPLANGHNTSNTTTAATHAAYGGGNGLLSLEIGGLVTNMHTSFLQDTSPPSSICSSMNNERMNNSLISSADFTNLNFLQSTNSLEPQEISDPTELNLTATIAPAGGASVAGSDLQYTLSDMIRDRKALESLTMSGDGTLIKDSQIGQIDDISLATLSKTASGCSTMDNSTDSVSTCPNEQQQVQVQPQQALRPTMLLSEEMIGDTNISLVDSLTTSMAATPIAESLQNATFKRPQVPAQNETLLLVGRQANTTYTEGCDTPEETVRCEATRCETPENIERTLSALQMESTPLTTATSARFPLHAYNNNNNNNNNNSTNINNNTKPWGYTPTLKGRGEINISPIVNGSGNTSGATTTPLRSRPSRLNRTYDQPQLQEAATGATVTAAASNTFVTDTLELLEQIEQPVLDLTYSMSEEQKQMQCILDLAEAEVELLAQQDGDEEQFEHMLAELGKVNSLNAEQLKMQKSLESIKRRFHREEDHQVEPQQQQQQPRELEHVQQVQLTPPSGHQTMLLSSHSPSQSAGSGSGERLLSRRSRLYDDVNLSAMHDSNASGLSNTSCNSKSFIVHRREEEPPAQMTDACSPLQEEQAEQQTEPAANYKLAERRERDRERFKTIKITKEMRARDEQLDNIVVPCIDDEVEPLQPAQPLEAEEQQEHHSIRQESPPGRLSRRDQTESSVGPSNNYLTYKKPKEKSLLMRHQQQQQLQEPQQQEQLATAESNQGQSLIARSLSRPRYISGLQKFTTVSKATSASAGLNATANASTTAATTTTAEAGELKSPMGIKSKSFHNLSINNGGITGPSAFIAPRPSLGGGGLRRPGVQSSGRLPSGLPGAQQQEPNDTSTFKVPKLISGLRAPNTVSGAKRAVGNGLARPSSGYYSMKPAAESETPESLSSASSRGSLYGKDNKPNHSFDAQTLNSKLTQVTTGATGIPKPSGLRQPTQMKRSGLPRPSSIVRR